MLNERHVLRLRFDSLAAKYDEECQNSRWPTARLSQLNNEAGNLVIAAFERGLLAIPGLAALVEWVKNPPPFPPGAKAQLFACPGNLFLELCGNNRFPGRRREDGRFEIIGDAAGGVLPNLLPSVLPGPTCEQTAAGQHKKSIELYALVCRLLGEQIERSNDAEARDSWVYEQAVAQKPWKWIRTQIPVRCANWDLIETDNGVKDIARRFAKRHGLRLPTKRRAGSPKRERNTK